MGKTLSMDLRSCAFGAVESSKNCRASAEQFGVAPSTVIRWRSRQKEARSFESGRRGRRAGSVLDGHRNLGDYQEFCAWGSMLGTEVIPHVREEEIT
jgi:transposase